MTIDERLDRRAGIVESLAASVVEHDGRIEALIQAAGNHAQEMADLRRQSRL